MTEVTRSIDTRLGTLRVHLPSATPDLLLWPGVLFDSALHRPLQRALHERRVSCALVEPPGFAGSTLRNRDLTIEDCAGAYIDVLDGLQLDSATLGGTSWGGATSLFAALRFPDRVQAVVAMNAPLARGHKQGILSVAHRLVEVVPPPIFAAAGIKDSIAPRRLPTMGPQTARMMTRSLRSAAPGDRRAVARAVFRDYPGILSELDQLYTPVLLLAGHKDALCPLRRQRRAARTLPDAELVEFPAAGHLTALEESDAAALEIAAFLYRRSLLSLPAKPGNLSA